MIQWNERPNSSLEGGEVRIARICDCCSTEVLPDATQTSSQFDLCDRCEVHLAEGHICQNPVCFDQLEQQLSFSVDDNFFPENSTTRFVVPLDFACQILSVSADCMSTQHTSVSYDPRADDFIGAIAWNCLGDVVFKNRKVLVMSFPNDHVPDEIRSSQPFMGDQPKSNGHRLAFVLIPTRALVDALPLAIASHGLEIWSLACFEVAISAFKISASGWGALMILAAGDLANAFPSVIPFVL